MDWLPGIACIVLLVICWFLWISRGGKDADDVEAKGLRERLSYRFHRAWRRLAFWAGNVHFMWQWYFFIPLPHITWAHHGYKVDIDELLKVCKYLFPGDVVLATKHGYLFSNSAIPGCFKHAAIITRGGPDAAYVRLVEAVSEGVLAHHPLNARADLMIIVRPQAMTKEEQSYAALIAEKIVGCRYDASFNFNIDDELARIGAGDKSAFTEVDQRELVRAHMNFQAEFDIAFSCTEVVATAWWHRRRQLGISRKKVRGRLVITADQFVNRDFDIVWTNVTPEEAEARGLHEEGVREIKRYWEVKDDV
jgi:hypothetical protein